MEDNNIICSVKIILICSGLGDTVFAKDIFYIAVDTVPAKSLGRSYRNSMKRAINSVTAVYCWYLCIEALTVLVSGHSPFLNPGGYADFPQPPWHRLPELDLGQRSVTSRTWSLARTPGCRKSLIVRGA